MRGKWSILALCLITVWTLPAIADEISDQIKEGLQSYDQGNYTEAVGALNYAVGQIQQKQAQGLKSVFPEPLSGWKAEETSGNIAPAAIMGGGVAASRHYYVEDSDKSVDIEVITDAPMLQSMMMFFNNPAFLASEPNSKLVKIKGQKAVQKYSAQDRDGEINIVLQSRMLVSVKGYGLDSLDDLMAYANAIDYDALDKFLKN